MFWMPCPCCIWMLHINLMDALPSLDLILNG
jgi:hypothetical protein